MRNLNVLPLSEQLRAERGDADLISIPLTVTTESETSIFTPRAVNESIVANTSRQEFIPRIVLIPSAIAAQIKRRCAIDLDGGA
jgi:hypothetical protein